VLCAGVVFATVEVESRVTDAEVPAICVVASVDTEMSTTIVVEGRGVGVVDITVEIFAVVSGLRVSLVVGTVLDGLYGPSVVSNAVGTNVTITVVLSMSVVDWGCSDTRVDVTDDLGVIEVDEFDKLPVFDVVLPAERHDLGQRSQFL